MKIIGASYNKTGTKTLHAALEELGYSVIDYPEQWYDETGTWLKLLSSGGTIEDFRNLYKDVDVTLDMPGAYFWEEISQAFPEAKVNILL